MIKYYLEIVKENIFIELDSKTNHQFQIGDLFLIEYDLTKTVLTLNKSGEIIKFNNPSFLIIKGYESFNLSIAVAITQGYIVDVTLQINRNKKLNQLGL
jgi:hypothetical protein